VPAPLLAVACTTAAFLFHWRGVDVPAQIYRIGLFRHYGFVLWDSQWYSGHAVPSYSALFPAIGATAGLFPTVAVSAGVAASAFDSLVRSRLGDRADAASAVFAIGLLVPVSIGQFPFLSGAAAGLLALAAGVNHRRWPAAVAALACALLSPVAGAFLVVATTAWWVTARAGQRMLPATLALACAAPLLALGIAFPDPGRFPFWSQDFVVTVLVCGLGLIFVPTNLRAIRVALVLYAVIASVLYIVPNPMGGNFGRLCATFAPALTVLLAVTSRRKLLALLVVPLLVWQWSPAVGAVTSTSTDASSHRSYFAPLLEYFETQPRTGRVEIPFTAGHWEAAFVAPHVALARGWERQLDMADNPLFYGNQRLTPKRYRAWLDATGVQWIALPDVPMDYSAKAETRLLQHPPSYLRLVWTSRHWRVWKVLDSPGIVRGAGTLLSINPDHLTVEARATGTLDLRLRYTSMWDVTSGRACIERGPGGWTRLVVATPGRVTIGTSILDADGCDTR
jgi:hypothetical protein